jgi:hypothetical protein
MPKKRKKIVFKLKDTAPKGDTKRYRGGGGGKDTEPDEFGRDLMVLKKDIRALTIPKLTEFFDKHLMVKGMESHDKACEHVDNTCKTPAGLQYVRDELNKFLDIKGQPQPKQPGDSSPESESESESESEPEEEAKKPFLPEELEESPDFPDADSMSDFEQFARDSLEVAKAKLQEQLDRLTVCEARLDENDKQHTSFNEWADSTEEVITTLKDKVIDEIKAAIAGAKGLPEGGGVGGGEFIVRYEQPDKPDKKVKGVFPKEWKRILELTSSRVNTLLVGPSGVGKTFLAKKVAEALGLRYSALSCSEGMDEGIFQGIVLPIGENGTFEYVASQFVDFYENGGVFLLDELDAADANLMTFINAAIGNNYFYLPRRWKNPYIKRHKNFVIIAAANTYGHGGDMIYNARNQLDGATLDRFRSGLVQMDYSEKVEKAIIDPDIYDWAIWVRKGIKALQMNRLMSTRVMEDFTKLKAHHNWEQNDFEKIYFQDWAKDDVKRIHEWIIKEIETIQQRLRGKKDEANQS